MSRKGSVIVEEKHMVFGNIIIISLVLLIMQSALTQAQISINEVMYNPPYSDSYNEWIEIYNNDESIVNLTNWKICEEEIVGGYKNHDDEQVYLENDLTIKPGDYGIITDGGSGTEAYNNFLIDNNSIALHVNSSTICGGLSNTHEIVTIKNDKNELVDTISYYNSWGASNNNRSLCKIPDGSGPWQECESSPGSSNLIQPKSYNLLINEFIPNPEGADDAPIPDGEWIEVFNNGNEEINLEGFVIKDDYGNGMTVSTTNVVGSTIIRPNSLLTIYRNTDGRLELNNDEDKITLYDPNENIIDEVSYSSSKEGLSWSKIGDRWLETVPTPNRENFYQERINDSRIKIEKVYLGSDESAQFGDMIRVKIDVYKGDTNKYNIEAYIRGNNEKISKTSKISLFNKFTNYTITLPLQIIPNCNLEHKEGDYDLIIKGLDDEDKENIKIEGISEDLCERIEVENECSDKMKESPKRISFASQEENENNINSQTTSLTYKSRSTKSKDLAIYFYSLVLLLITIGVIKWKKPQER